MYLFLAGNWSDGSLQFNTQSFSFLFNVVNIKVIQSGFFFIMQSVDIREEEKFIG